MFKKTSIPKCVGTMGLLVSPFKSEEFLFLCAVLSHLIFPRVESGVSGVLFFK